MNINRAEGFPLCAETLEVLNDNSEMFSQWLKEIPLKNRQAVIFGNHLLVCQNLQKRWVKLGAVSAALISQCKLVFHTPVSHTVQDSSGHDYYDVWLTEKADIVDETSPNQQWTLLGLQHVFETRLWYDYLPSFEAGLPGATVSDGSFVSAIALYEDNVLRGNNERIQMRMSLSYSIRAKLSSILSIPIPFDCPDGTRMEADLQVISTGTHYPVRAYTEGGMLKIDIGRWLKDEGLFHPINNADWIQCNDIIRINKEVVL